MTFDKSTPLEHGHRTRRTGHNIVLKNLSISLHFPGSPKMPESYVIGLIPTENKLAMMMLTFRATEKEA